mgnify:CR=1|tara:strand:- start:3709 stop:3957 length:249 start_codon:yes stop_codon:yes gene_type:complete
MAKLNNTKEGKGFFRFMTAIGVLVIGGLIFAFIEAAPPLPLTNIHVNAQQPNDCLACHVNNIENNPIMPHRPMESCVSCHTK